MCKSRKKYNIGSNQSGVVSIFVTLIIMIILSIVVIGFSQISRREARAALDRQLSTQAFYAAESGINDAYSIVNKAIGTPLGPIPATSQCNSPSYINGTSNQIDPTTNTASYTCLLVNVQPTYLTFLPQTGQPELAD